MSSVSSANERKDYEPPKNEVEKEDSASEPEGKEVEQKSASEGVPADNKEELDGGEQPEGSEPIEAYDDTPEGTTLAEDKTIEGVEVPAGSEVVSDPEAPIVVFENPADDTAADVQAEKQQQVFFTEVPTSESVDEAGNITYGFDNHNVVMATDGSVHVYAAGATEPSAIYGSPADEPPAVITGVYAHDRGTTLNQAQTAQTPEALQALIDQEAWVSPTGETDEAIFQAMFEKRSALMPASTAPATPEAQAQRDLIQSLEAKRLSGELDEGVADVFGEAADVDGFMALMDESMMTGNYEWMPTVRFVERGQAGDDPADGTLQGAAGAFMPASNEILVAADLRDDPQAVSVVTTHEMGHKIDQLVQPQGMDTPGDEGLAFSLWMNDAFYDDTQPSGLSAPAQAAFNAESDAGLMTDPITGEPTAVEFFDPERMLSIVGPTAGMIYGDDALGKVFGGAYGNAFSNNELSLDSPYGFRPPYGTGGAAPAPLPGLSEPFVAPVGYQMGDPIVYTDDQNQTRVQVYGDVSDFDVVETAPGIFDVQQNGESVIGGPQQIDFLQIAPSPFDSGFGDLLPYRPSMDFVLDAEYGQDAPIFVVDESLDNPSLIFPVDRQPEPPIIIDLNNPSANAELAATSDDPAVWNLLTDLGHHEDRTFAWQVARNDATPSDRLTTLHETYYNEAGSTDWPIVEQIVSNNNAPVALQAQVAANEDAPLTTLSAIARNTNDPAVLNSVYENYAQRPSILPNMQQFLAQGPNSPQAEQALSQAGSEISVLSALAGNPNTPPDILPSVYEDSLEHPAVAQSIASNPNAPPQLVVSVFEDHPTNTGVATAINNNPNNGLSVIDGDLHFTDENGHSHAIYDPDTQQLHLRHLADDSAPEAGDYATFTPLDDGTLLSEDASQFEVFTPPETATGSPMILGEQGKPVLLEGTADEYEYMGGDENGYAMYTHTATGQDIRISPDHAHVSFGEPVENPDPNSDAQHHQVRALAALPQASYNLTYGNSIYSSGGSVVAGEEGAGASVGVLGGGAASGVETLGAGLVAAALFNELREGWSLTTSGGPAGNTEDKFHLPDGKTLTIPAGKDSVETRQVALNAYNYLQGQNPGQDVTGMVEHVLENTNWTANSTDDLGTQTQSFLGQLDTYNANYGSPTNYAEDYDLTYNNQFELPNGLSVDVPIKLENPAWKGGMNEAYDHLVGQGVPPDQANQMIQDAVNSSELQADNVAYQFYENDYEDPATTAALDILEQIDATQGTTHATDFEVVEGLMSQEDMTAYFQTMDPQRSLELIKPLHETYASGSATSMERQAWEEASAAWYDAIPKNDQGTLADPERQLMKDIISASPMDGAVVLDALPVDESASILVELQEENAAAVTAVLDQMRNGGHEGAEKANAIEARMGQLIADRWAASGVMPADAAAQLPLMDSGVAAAAVAAMEPATAASTLAAMSPEDASSTLEEMGAQAATPIMASMAETNPAFLRQAFDVMGDELFADVMFNTNTPPAVIAQGIISQPGILIDLETEQVIAGMEHMTPAQATQVFEAVMDPENEEIFGDIRFDLLPIVGDAQSMRTGVRLNTAMFLFRRDVITSPDVNDNDTPREIPGMTTDQCFMRSEVFARVMLGATESDPNTQVMGHVQVWLGGDGTVSDPDGWSYHVAPVVHYNGQYFVADTTSGFSSIEEWTGHYEHPSNPTPPSQRKVKFVPLNQSAATEGGVMSSFTHTVTTINARMDEYRTDGSLERDTEDAMLGTLGQTGTRVNVATILGLRNWLLGGNPLKDQVDPNTGDVIQDGYDHNQFSGMTNIAWAGQPQAVKDYYRLFFGNNNPWQP